MESLLESAVLSFDDLISANEKKSDEGIIFPLNIIDCYFTVAKAQFGQ